MQNNAIEYYWMPVVTMLRRIEHLPDGLKRFLWVEKRQRICNEHDGPQDQIDILSGFFSMDHRCTVRKLPEEVGLSHQTVWHIMKKCLNRKKIEITPYKNGICIHWLVST
ncbi:hypothetical protein TNCV_1215881 [Trichonephila clavipes]|nr:hypothetical protein TNCV_1215881 [Trichonephila clavipes]